MMLRDLAEENGITPPGRSSKNLVVFNVAVCSTVVKRLSDTIASPLDLTPGQSEDGSGGAGVLHPSADPLACLSLPVLLPGSVLYFKNGVQVLTIGALLSLENWLVDNLVPSPQGARSGSIAVVDALRVLPLASCVHRRRVVVITGSRSFFGTPPIHSHLPAAMWGELGGAVMTTHTAGRFAMFSGSHALVGEDSGDMMTAAAAAGSARYSVGADMLSARMPDRHALRRNALANYSDWPGGEEEGGTNAAPLERGDVMDGQMEFMVTSRSSSPPSPLRPASPAPENAAAFDKAFLDHAHHLPLSQSPSWISVTSQPPVRSGSTRVHALQEPPSPPSGMRYLQHEASLRQLIEEGPLHSNIPLDPYTLIPPPMQTSSYLPMTGQEQQLQHPTTTPPTRHLLRGVSRLNNDSLNSVLTPASPHSVVGSPHPLVMDIPRVNCTVFMVAVGVQAMQQQHALLMRAAHPGGGCVSLANTAPELFRMCNTIASCLLADKYLLYPKLSAILATLRSSTPQHLPVLLPLGQPLQVCFEVVGGVLGPAVRAIVVQSSLFQRSLFVVQE